MRGIPSVTGIYQVRHIGSGRCYVGSGINVSARLSAHLSALRNGKHFSKHLQRAYDKYGESAFAFEIIETCLNEKTILAAREQFWVDHYRDQGIELFNKRLLVEINTMVKLDQSPERKEYLRNQLNYARQFRPNACNTQFRDDDIRGIINAYIEGESPSSLAKQHSLYKSTIYDILARRTWDFVDLDPETESKLKAKIEAMPRKLSPEQRNLIVELFRQGKTADEIATSLSIHPVTAKRIMSEETGPSRKNGRRCLFDCDVREIKRRIATGERYANIAQDYNVSIMTISSINTGRAYRDVSLDTE